MNTLKKEVEVTAETMALVAKVNDFGKVITEVMMMDGTHEVPVHPGKMIDDACKFFASSLAGRTEGTKQVSGFTHKPPIVISQSMGMYFFPITSPKRKDCTWIAHAHIQSIHSVDGYNTIMRFSNGTAITLPVSKGVIANQIQRTAQFRFLLESRIKHSSPYTAEKVAEPFA
ncbi:competence protein ComK [Thalassobacillus hwangdonensis]|uniref:Competence protein ComK n=1 Tax=Thalassobacillus hwangdonensis TaxID=546108 RepID=A0ABW3KXC8_9BACI